MRPTLPISLSGLILGLVLLLFPLTAEAQFKASVQGTVTDTSGAIVAEATVTLTNTETNQSEATTTSDGGFYRFSGLAPGIYTLTVEKESFKKRVVNDVKVDAESIAGVNIELEAGGITETVTITAENVGLETEDPNIRKIITTQEVLLLPQAGRDPYQLARLTPGVFGDGARGANGASANLPNTSGPGGSNVGIFATENQVQISANGQRLSANNFQVDGTSVNSQTWGGAAVITPSQESVKEVQVTSSTYSAEDGRNSGAQVKVVTQNGTNDFHGSAFFKLNDPALNAFNKFHGIPGVVTAVPTRVEEKFKTYGGSVGGPILHEKLFFFFSYEGLRNNTNNTYTAFIDTAQFRQTIISARPNTVTAQVLSAPGIEPRVLQILPVTCATAGLSVPCQDVAGGLDIGSPTGTYGQYLLSSNPTGGGFDGIPDLQFAQLENPSSFRGHQFFGRVDYNLSANDRLAFSSFFTPVTATTSDRDAQTRPQADIISKRLNYAIGFIYGRNISSTMLNEARFNITRWGFDELTTNPNTNFALPRVGIEGIISNGARLRYGAPRSLNTPGDIDEKQLDFRDTLSKVSGNHSLKFGGEFRFDLNHNGEVGGARPEYSFFRPWNLANGTPIFETIAATANGKPSPNNTPFRTSDLAFFIQDDWKFRPNLTLNLGLRWEYFSPITATEGVVGNLSLGPNNGFAGATIVTDKTLTDKDLNNFGPQLGFAWSPRMFNDKLVVRGGFGIGFDRLPNALLANARRNPPNGAFYDLCCGTSGIPPDDNWSTPFVGGTISYVASSDNTIFGYPANPNLGGGTNATTGLPNRGTVEIWGTPRDLSNAYVYRYSLEGQYELPAKMVGTVGYQGSAGRHFVRIIPLHILAPNSNPSIRAAFFASPDTNSNYNALITNLRRRFSHGLQFSINYRFSKSIDNSSYESPCGCTNQSYPVDQKEERGPSDFDVTHFFTADGLWELPLFLNDKSLKGKLLGGWQINPIVTWRGGFPWTPRIGSELRGPSGLVFGNIRPTHFFGSQPLSNTNSNFLQPGGIFPGGGALYFSTTTNGDSPLLNPPGIGRNVFRGPRYFSTDISFVKRTRLPNMGFFGENAALDVRFNFFNIFNNLNLAPFGAGSDSTRVTHPRFGVATDALAGRTGEFQVRFSF